MSCVNVSACPEGTLHIIYSATISFTFLMKVIVRQLDRKMLHGLYSRSTRGGTTRNVEYPEIDTESHCTLIAVMSDPDSGFPAFLVVGLEHMLEKT